MKLSLEPRMTREMVSTQDMPPSQRITLEMASVEDPPRTRKELIAKVDRMIAAHLARLAIGDKGRYSYVDDADVDEE